MEENKINKNLKIIITIAVIIILLLALIFGVIYTINNQSENNNKNELGAENIITQNEIKQVEEAEKVVENTIIEDETATLNRRYGKVEIVWVDKNNNVIAKPLSPVLNGLKAVKFSDEKRDFEEVVSNEDIWYDYKEQRWANAIDASGSYFVWIPRYAYKIIYYSDSTYSKEIGISDYRGILKINNDGSLSKVEDVAQGLTEVGNHYILAPAFSVDTASGYRNGGWDRNLSGIWVSKYEMSMEEEGIHIDTTSKQIGDVLTNEKIKAVSKPGVSSWRNITVGTSYINAYNYNRNLDSHLIKNSEWGAISYLAFSKYGRNGMPITINKNNNYITGGHNLLSEIYSYNGNQSTTGNETGVYDLVGCSWEFTASFVNNDDDALSNYGGKEENELYENTRNSKYKTVYVAGSLDKKENMYQSNIANQNYSLTNKRRGEAIFETSMSGYGTDSWNTSSSFFAQRDTPFFERGGDFSSGTGAGVFSFNGSNGQADAGVSYRVVLVCE